MLKDAMQMNRKKFFISSIFVFLLLEGLFFVSLPSKCFSEQKESIATQYYLQGKQHQTLGKFQEAIEDYQKVLYAEQNYARASWGLAEIYESRGEFKKAEKEYYYFLKVLNNDPTFDAQTRLRLSAIAQEKINEFKIFRKKNIHRYEGKPGIYAVTTLFLGLLLVTLLSVTLCFKGVLFIRDKVTEKQRKKLWIEAYWEERKERELDSFPLPLSVCIAIIIALFIFGGTCRVIYLYGFEESFQSLFKAFSHGVGW
jgi:tetratricopeptide (TPR) repeat protein